MLQEEAVRLLSHWLHKHGMRRDVPALATGILMLVGCMAVLVVSHLVHSMPVAAAYVQLVLCLWVFQDTTDHIFLLWVSYSYAYSTAGAGVEENVIILSASTLVHLGGIVASILARKRFEQQERAWIWLMGCVLLLPARCNNLFYEPGIAVARIAAFAIICTMERDAPWFLRQYPLFCKVELVPFVAVAHLVARRIVDRQTPPVDLLPVTADSDSFLFDQDDDDDNDTYAHALEMSLSAIKNQKGD